MEKIEKLKLVLYQIVGENEFLLNALEVGLDQANVKLIVNIIYNRCSLASFKDMTVCLGVPDIIDSFDLSNTFNLRLDADDKYIINPEYSNYCSKENVRGIVDINIPGADKELVDKLLTDSLFLNDDSLSQIDTISTFSLAYSLYHEVGHLVHDKEIDETQKVRREKEADLFAVKAIKSMCIEDHSMNDARIKGAIMGIAQMLMYRTPQQELDDKAHPHSIERLYSLLDNLGIKDDSNYWELACIIVSKWCEKNKMADTWTKKTSVTYKDKFIDAYTYFKKS